MANKQKAYAQVIRYFREGIANGTYSVGEKLPAEREIAETLGVSRNSVREAMRIMDMTGVISSRQGSGNFITCDFEKSMVESLSMMFAMKQIDYRQLIQLRRALESMAARLAVQNATDEEIGLIADCVGRLAVSTDTERNTEIDKLLHFTMAHASGNLLIEIILNALSTVIGTFMKDMHYEILKEQERKDQLNASHYQLKEGLRLRDAAMAEDALEQHFDLLDRIIDEGDSDAGNSMTNINSSDWIESRTRRY